MSFVVGGGASPRKSHPGMSPEKRPSSSSMEGMLTESLYSGKVSVPRWPPCIIEVRHMGHVVR